ncbi:pyridoxal phosphate-dependent aminotransferase [Planctomycetota bacterium]
MKQCARMQQVQTPIIPIVGQWIRQHPGTISLGQGIVAYGPPPPARERLDGFFDQLGVHRYHPVNGIPPLRERLGQKLHQENGIVLSEDGQSDGYGLCVSAGANMAFMNTVMAITDPGDQILVLRPFYFNHEMAIQMAGCTAVVVDTDASYQPVLARIADSITPRTRAVVTISPNNPTGAVYPEATLRAINTLCRRRGIFHIHDEAYEYFTFDGVAHFSPGSIAGSEDYTISLFSLSKAYGFAGWRIGYMVFPQRLEESIKKVQDTLLICPPVVSQVAALGALEAGRDYCQQNQPSIQESRELVWEGLQQIPDLCTVPRPQGAFYYLPKIKTSRSGMEVAECLVREFKVAVIPGEAFGLKQGCYLRISYGALDTATAGEGVARLVCGLKQLVGDQG